MFDIRRFFDSGRLTLLTGAGHPFFARQHTEPRLPQPERFSTSAEIYHIDYIENAGL